MAKEVRIVFPDSVYKKLISKFDEEGYNSVRSFILDIVRDRVMVKDKRKVKGRKKKTFLDHFSRRKV